MTATTISDMERREVARRLRSVAREVDRGGFSETIKHVKLAVFEDLDRYRPNGTLDRLADLIEPSDSAQTIAEDMFGQMRHSTEQERVAYADMMSRNSVELHPVDRDALLALAEDVDGAADDSGGFEPLAGMLRDIARRIREACGEVVG